MMDATTKDTHRVDPGHAAVIGLAIGAGLCMIFWATAAANVLPSVMPAPIRSFTPAAGVARLLVGLVLTGLAGAVVALLAVGAFNLAAWAARRRHAH
jgi:hypothetical protein